MERAQENERGGKGQSIQHGINYGDNERSSMI